jgi:hypothetical protein
MKFNHLDDPGMFEDWGKALKFFGGAVLFGLLCWAAIFEIIYW